MKNIKLDGMSRLAFVSVLCMVSTCSNAEMHCIPGNDGISGERCTTTVDKPGTEPSGPIIGGGGGGGNNSGGDGGGGGEDAPHNNRNEPKPEEDKEKAKEECLYEVDEDYHTCRTDIIVDATLAVESQCGKQPSSTSGNVQGGLGAIGGGVTLSYDNWARCKYPIEGWKEANLSGCEVSKARESRACYK